MFKRPTILCRRSTGNEHEFVVALPRGSDPGAADRFAASREIESFRRLSGGRISFRMVRGPALTNLIWDAFSGALGGYPVVRAVMEPGTFPAEQSGCDLSNAPKTKEPKPEGVPAGSRRMPLGAAVAVGVAFLLGMGANGLLRQADAPPAGAGETAPTRTVERPENVAVDLGTFLSARGPAAAFRSKDGTLRYAMAHGSLEGRLHPGMEVRVAPDVRPALFTPVRELRDSDGSYVFHQSPALEETPDLSSYSRAFDPNPGADLAWETAVDSTRSFYALRSGWREIGSRPVELRGVLEETGENLYLRAGALQARLVELDDVDRLNLSMAAGSPAEIRVFGRIETETPWKTLRLDPAHSAFSFRVDWIEPEPVELLCRADGIE